MALFSIGAIVLQQIGEMEIKRTPPDKAAVLRDIDDDDFRQVFAAANLESSEDMGSMDNAIVSRWCGVSEEAVKSLIDRKILIKSDSDAFNRLRLSAPRQFDEYAIRSSGYREFGIGRDQGSDCVELLIMG